MAAPAVDASLVRRLLEQVEKLEARVKELEAEKSSSAPPSCKLPGSTPNVVGAPVTPHPALRERPSRTEKEKKDEEGSKAVVTPLPKEVTNEVPTVPMESTRLMMHQIVLPAEVDELGFCMGGQVLCFIDLAAGLAAKTLARGPCVTASVDSVHFLRPCRLGSIMIVAAMVNRTFASSMEVGVRVETECRATGARAHCCSAYLTFVSVNSRGPDGIKLPRLEPGPNSQLVDAHEHALQRRQTRLAAKKALASDPEAAAAEALCRLAPVTHGDSPGGRWLPPSPTLPREARGAKGGTLRSIKEARARAPRVAPSATLAHVTHSVMPQHANTLGIAFGGQIIRWIEAASYISAARLRSGHLLTASMDSVVFDRPTRIGDILYISAIVTAVFDTSLEVMISVFAQTPFGLHADSDPASMREPFHVADAYATIVSVDRKGNPMHVPFQLHAGTRVDKLRAAAALARRGERLRLRREFISGKIRARPKSFDSPRPTRSARIPTRRTSLGGGMGDPGRPKLGHAQSAVAAVRIAPGATCAMVEEGRESASEDDSGADGSLHRREAHGMSAIGRRAQAERLTEKAKELPGATPPVPSPPGPAPPTSGAEPSPPRSYAIPVSPNRESMESARSGSSGQASLPPGGLATTLSSAQVQSHSHETLRGSNAGVGGNDSHATSTVRDDSPHAHGPGDRDKRDSAWYNVGAARNDSKVIRDELGGNLPSVPNCLMPNHAEAPATTRAKGMLAEAHCAGAPAAAHAANASRANGEATATAQSGGQPCKPRAGEAMAKAGGLLARGHAADANGANGERSSSSTDEATATSERSGGQQSTHRRGWSRELALAGHLDDATGEVDDGEMPVYRISAEKVKKGRKGSSSPVPIGMSVGRAGRWSAWRNVLEEEAEASEGGSFTPHRSASFCGSSYMLSRLAREGYSDLCGQRPATTVSIASQCTLSASSEEDCADRMLELNVEDEGMVWFP